MPKAARILDPIGHVVISDLMKALIVGLAIAVVGVAIVAIGPLAGVAIACAAVALGRGLGPVLGAELTKLAGSMEVSGKIIGVCSSNVFINGKPAARAIIDFAICSKHSSAPNMITSGSGTVFINGRPAARVEDTIACSAVIADGSSNVFIGGGKSHPILAISDDMILKGRGEGPNYLTRTIDEKNKIINVEVLMNYKRPDMLSIAGGLTSMPTDEEFKRYEALANAGIGKHWSTTAMLNGVEYKVNVTAKTSKDGLPIALAKPGWERWGDQSSRSRNPHPVMEGNLYLDGKPQNDAKFGEVAAHEVGHSFLTEAFGIKFSWEHEGSSSMGGEVHKHAPVVPLTGPIPLMPYSHDNKAVSKDDVIKRTVASEEDAKTLIYIAPDK
ncbi:PAAR domain-containing protein [Massilia violaceinigra]|uniref:PAAR domain-containing protein n=1 Tax=Massilia violaceinigra TaxID=2045208 RepID=A0ABY4A4D6_9BURK|nr:PAAR domain-containing protein [Massilia violaceinigra]UOD29533.1 PAAR domain-containing protein [Massilia violaceinigra]